MGKIVVLEEAIVQLVDTFDCRSGFWDKVLALGMTILQCMICVQRIRDLQIQVLELVETFIPAFLAEGCVNAVGAIGLEDVMPHGSEVGPLEKFVLLLKLENEVVDGLAADVGVGPLLVKMSAKVGSEVCEGTHEAITRMANMRRLDEVGDLSILGILGHGTDGVMTADLVIRSGIVEKIRRLDSRATCLRNMNIQQRVFAANGHGAVGAVEDVRCIVIGNMVIIEVVLRLEKHHRLLLRFGEICKRDCVEGEF